LFETNDIAIAAYLMMKGLPLKDCSIAPTGKYIFIFHDPNNLAHQLSLEFLNSDCSRFDNQMRNLRKLLASKKRP
tara:strand:- start:447 stop:671 length:225 start_codon:yes stop_codon:yes gene_type:complete